MAEFYKIRPVCVLCYALTFFTEVHLDPIFAADRINALAGVSNIVFIQGLVNVCGGEPLVLPLVDLMEKSSQHW